MTSYLIVWESGSGATTYWTYGNPGQWSQSSENARLYARRQSAHNARLRLLKHRPDLNPEELKIQETEG